MRRAIVLLLASAPALARDPSQVVFPPQKIPLKFSHRQHLAFKLQCDFCHEAAESSTGAADNLMPPEDTCATCHKIDRDQPGKQAKPAARCDACHVGATDPAKPPRVEVPAPQLKFNHKIHVDRRIGCDRCHGDMKQVDLGTRAQLPRMPLCLGCHNQTAQAGRAPAKCTTCHLARFDGTIETRLPTGVLAPSGTLKGDAHTPEFMETRHARVAAQDEGYCMTCHRRETCTACHNGVLKPLSFHGNDYVSIHPIDARREAMDCNACHRRQSFCLGCHERAGVVDKRTVDAPHTLPNVSRQFHPAGWIEQHGRQSQRNLRQCVSCHREDTCIECHSATTSGASPHPAAFGASRECRSLAAKNARVCLKCHAPSDRRINCN